MELLQLNAKTTKQEATVEAQLQYQSVGQEQESTIHLSGWIYIGYI